MKGAGCTGGGIFIDRVQYRSAVLKPLLVSGISSLLSSLDLRPMYDPVSDRIRAHVLTCWLAFLLVRIADIQGGRVVGEDQTPTRKDTHYRDRES
jgi:hypothetical protein